MSYHKTSKQPDTALGAMQENTPDFKINPDFETEAMDEFQEEGSSEEDDGEHVISASMQFELNSSVASNSTKEIIMAQKLETVNDTDDDDKGNEFVNSNLCDMQEELEMDKSSSIQNGQKEMEDFNTADDVTADYESLNFTEGLSNDNDTLSSNLEDKINDQSNVSATLIPVASKMQPELNKNSSSVTTAPDVKISNERSSIDAKNNDNADDNLDLPPTVTMLKHSSGGIVYLVGTAHFSKESQDDVIKTIKITKPNIIVLELCNARTAVLELDEETILNESKSLDFSKISMIIKQQGKIQGILYLLFLSVSAHITKQLNMAPGGEFRVAIHEARRSCPKCVIQLGDRPIHVTLGRALASLSVWHKLKLMVYIMLSKGPISKEEVEKCKNKDFIEQMLAEMTGQFPGISEVFVQERDIYLTRSIQLAADPNIYRTLSGPTARRVVVGVVGMGHVAGIVKAWDKITEEDVSKIMQIPPTPLSDRLFMISLRITAVGLVGYGAYRFIPKSAKSFLTSSLNASLSFLQSQWPISDSEYNDKACLLYMDDDYEHVIDGLIYITTCCFGLGIDQCELSPIKGCQCKDCCRSASCSCMNSFSSIESRFNDTLPIFECNFDCQCILSCGNRKVQGGPRVGLKILPTCDKGFGVFTSLVIPMGSFVCEYAGEIICIKEGQKRLSALNPDNSNYILVMREHFADTTIITVVDPTILGNIGRYLNHSCQPNLKVVPVRTTSWVPVPALIATRNIASGEELCYDYESNTYCRSSYDSKLRKECPSLVSSESVDPLPIPSDSLHALQMPSALEPLLMPSVSEKPLDLLSEGVESKTKVISARKCLCRSKYCRKSLPFNENLFS